MKRIASPTRPAGRSARALRARVARTGFTLAPLALAALTLTQGAHALPTGLQTVAGTAQIAQPDANTMVITTAQQKTIFNAQNFGIGAQERLTVNQPGSTSATMFSVLGYDPSYILGQLQSNGRVFLQNPNGIVFGANARVDVGGLVATTLHLSDTDFLAGRYQLTDAGNGQGDLAGRVINQGTINATGGAVVLAGADVLNSGTIQADGGRVGLIAANKVLVDVEGDGLLFFEVDGREAGARLQQLGRIQADGGSVELMAASRGQFADTVLNMSGVVQARTLGLKEGRVVIDGGTAGVTLVSGSIDASGSAAGEHGGSVSVLGDKVGLVGTARIDASGDAGGGTVLVGGDVHGTGEHRASSTYVGANASIDASAKTRGDGGKVIVWSDGTTRFLGQINARGGLLGGNGGFAEVSGAQHLDYLGLVDLSAPSGAKGLLLLDPDSIEIVASGPDLNADATDLDLTSNNFNANDGDGKTSLITSGAIQTQLATANVSLKATNDITVNSEIKVTTGSAGLTLDAGRQITLNASITTKNGIALTGALTSGIAVGGTSADTAITLDAGDGQLGLGAVVSGTGRALNLVSNQGAQTAISVAGVNGVGDLNVNGQSTINGNVTTSGSQTYSDNKLKLGSSDVVFTANGATSKLTFNGEVDGNHHALTLTNNDNTADDAISTGTHAFLGNITQLNVNGNVTYRNSANAEGNQQYTGKVTIGGTSDAVVLHAGDHLNFASSLTGNGHNLTLEAGSTQNDAVNLAEGLSNVAALTVTGKSTVAGNVTTTGAQTYSAQLTLGGNVQLTGSSLGLASLSAGSNNLGLRADAITVSGAVSSSGSNTVTFEPLSNTGTISVASGAPVASGTLQLSQALLDKFSSFATIVLGSTANAYKIAVGDFNLPTDVVVRSSSGNLSFGALAKGHALSAQTTGLIDLNDVVGGSTDADKLASLDLSGQITVQGGAVRTSGNQRYAASSGAVTLGQDTVLDAGAGTITSSAIDGGTHGLTLNSSNAAAAAIQVDAIDHVSTLAVNGKATLNGNVTTSGNQTYSAALTLGTSATLDAGTGKIALASVAGGAHDLALKSSSTDADAIQTSGAIGGVTTLTVTGKATLGGNVTTTGNQTYGDALTLGANATLDAGAGKIALASVAGGAHDLALKSGNAAADAIQTSGAISNVATLAVTGKSTLGGDVSSSGTQTYTDTVTLGTAGAYTFTGSALSFNGLAAGANDLAFHAGNALTISGTLSGTGQVSIAGQAADTAISVGGPTADPNDLEISNSTLVLFGPSFSGVTIGRADGTGAITFTDYTLTRDLSVLSGTGAITFGTLDGAHALTAQTGGLITLAGNIGNLDQPTALTFNGNVRLANDFVYTSGAQRYNGVVTLAQSTQLNANGVSFGDTVDSEDATARALTIFSPAGVVRFGGAVGQNHALASLDVTSAQTRVSGDITVAAGGHQTYSGDVVLGQATTFRAPTLTFFNSLVAGNHDIGLLTDNPLVVGGIFGLGGSLSGTADIRIGAFTDSTTIGVAGGSGTLQIDQTRIDQLTAAGFHSVTIGSTTGTGDITVGTTGLNITLPADLTLQSGTGAINLQASVDGAHSLTLNTSGLTTIGAAVGSNTALTSLSTDAGGSTHLNANVNTTGNQTYGDAVELGNSVSSTTGAGASTTFASTVDSASGTSAALYIYGDAQLGAAVGAGQRIGALYVSGATQLGGDVSTTGFQQYAGATTLSRSVTLDSSGSYIYFPSGSTLDGAHDLTLRGATGNYLYGAVGGATALNSLTTSGSTYFATDTVRTSGAQTYAGNVQLYADATFSGTDIAFNGGLSGSGYHAVVDASGTTTLGGAAVAVRSLNVAHDAVINAASITTSGAQSYGGNVVLGSTTALSGNTIDFNGTVQAASNGVQGLTVADAGTTTFHGEVGGGGQALASLTTAAGGATVLPARVTTTGVQSYGSPVILSADAVLSGSSVSLAGLDGAHHGLTVHVPVALAFSGSLGNLDSLQVDGGGATSFDGTNGLSTTGAQSYAGAVTILHNGDAQFAGSSLTFNGGISGARNLTLSADVLQVAGALSGTGELVIAPPGAGATIDLTGGAADVSIDLNQTTGFTQRTIGNASGTGAIHAGALVLAGNTTLQSGSGNVRFDATIDGPYALAVQTGGAITMAGDIGGSAALGSLSLSSAQPLTLGNVHVTAGGAIKTDGLLTLQGNLQLDGGTLTLESTQAAGAGTKIRDADGNERVDLSLNNRVLKEAALAIGQSGGAITTAAGSTLSLRASGGGSIVVESASNNIQGNLSAVSGTPGEVGSARFAAGSDPLVVSAIRLRSEQIHAAGIEGDVVKLTAGSLNTVAGTKIRARLPYVNAQGTETSMPALTLMPTSPGTANQYGAVSPSSWIQVDVGDTSGGYVTVRPKGVGAGSSVIYLGGSETLVPFYDGTGKNSEIQVYYNGRTPSTPQEVGALSAVTAVIEESRRSRFEEVVRTENVSARLRTGVIAEVGSGRPATVGTESIRMPATCTPTNGLGC
jgi:filamentous hemagglutinin family protein